MVDKKTRIDMAEKQADRLREPLIEAKSITMEMQGVNLENDLKEQIKGYFPEGMSDDKKDEFASKISHDNKLYYQELTYEECPSSYSDKLYDKNSSDHIGREKILQDLLKDFRSSDSAVGRDLDNLLKHCNLEFRIVDDSKFEKEGPGRRGSPNGSGRFNKGEDGKVDKSIIFFNASTFNKEHIDKLPGLLAHELAHVLDFDRRPNGYHGMIDGQETFADLTGQIMAEKAGYKSLPFPKYMGDYVRKEKSEGRDGVVPGSPMGDFREETIILYEKENNSSYSKDVKNLDSYKTFLKNEELKRVRGKEEKHRNSSKKQPGSVKDSSAAQNKDVKTKRNTSTKSQTTVVPPGLGGRG